MRYRLNCRLMSTSRQRYRTIWCSECCRPTFYGYCLTDRCNMELPEWTDVMEIIFVSSGQSGPANTDPYEPLVQLRLLALLYEALELSKRTRGMLTTRGAHKTWLGLTLEGLDLAGRT